MTILKNYHEFTGRHWETGTICNALGYQGVKAPHTGEPVSEALLMGITGGATVGYFTFEYTGYLPHLALLTRNTFNPMETLLERLAIPQEVYRTDKPEKAEANLLEVLDSGRPALVWADMFTLPYNDMPADKGYWAMWPILIYGYENGTAYIADRSSQSLKVSADVLKEARGRVKKDSYRVVMLDSPDWSKLSAAVTQAIWQCISLYVEAPPKGARHNFGLAALEHWANLLTNTRNKQSWARYFPPGERLWMAVVGDRVQPGAYGWIRRSAGNSAERGMYADFLDEAAAILENPSLKEASALFRCSEQAWSEFARLLLPDDVPVFQEARALLDLKRSAFMEQGSEGLMTIQEANQRLKALQADAAANFPLGDSETAIYRERLAAQVSAIRALEAEAVNCLQRAMT